MTYTIDSQLHTLSFNRKPELDENGMTALQATNLGNKIYFYEPGDSYLYDAPDGGTSVYLGEVYSYG